MFTFRMPIVTMKYLSAVVAAVLGQQVVDVGVLDGTEHHRLPVVLGPVVQVPEPHPGEVHVVGLQWLQVHVLHCMLRRYARVLIESGTNYNLKKNSDSKKCCRLATCVLNLFFSATQI